jgi:hypothetical protein
MADNVPITPGAGANIAADEILGVKYPRSKMIVGADGVNDGDVSDANPVPMKIRGDEFFAGATKYDAKVTEDGELATTVTERERNVYAIVHNDAVGAGNTDYILVDRDDTVNFPHDDVSRIDLSTVNVHLSHSGGNPDGEMLLGVITRVNVTDADVTWAFVLDFNLPSNTDVREDFNFAPSQLKFEVTAGSTTRIISNYSDVADTTINTATLMDSPRGVATVTPDVGDVVLRIINGSGTLKAFCGVMYHGEP